MLRLIQYLIRLEWPVRLASPLIGKFNPFLREFRADPYPFYHRLRREAPVYFSPSLRGWILTRHADIISVFQDARFSADRRQATVFQKLDLLGSLREDFAAAVTRNLLMLDPPDHTRIRRLVSKAFTPRVVERLRPRIQEIVDQLLDQASGRGEMDLIRDLANPLPTIVIAEMLGAPAADRARFKVWSDALTSLLDPLQAEGGMAPAERAFFEIRAYLQRLFDERRKEPKADLISALVAVEEQGDTLDQAELVSLCMLILAAGNETTTNLLGNGILALLRNPAERERLQSDLSLVPAGVEELLRYDSPIQLTDRVATEDCEIGGHEIRKGQLVGLILGAANRDPEQFDDPDRLDVGRAENHHLAFGHGVHFCLGAQLARAEAQIAIASLLQRFPNIDGDRNPREYKRSIVLRGPTSLRLSLS